MLLDLVEKLFCGFKAHGSSVYKGLLLFAPTLLFQMPTEYKIQTERFLYSKFDVATDLCLPEAREYDYMPPHESIFVYVEGTAEQRDRIADSLQRLKLRTKSVIVSSSDSQEIYFLKMRIKIGANTHVQIRPFKNYQVSLDMLALALKFFKPKTCVSFNDLIQTSFDNAIDIVIEEDQSDYEKLQHFVRHLMNIESFDCCNYFYIPLASGYLRAEPLYIFVLAISALLARGIDSNIDPFGLAAAAVACHYCPVLPLVVFKSRYLALYAAVVTVVNFKAGFLLCLMRYLHIIVCKTIATK